MKPKNFPAKKLSRQIGAKNGICAEFILKCSWGSVKKDIDMARVIRTKKHR